MNRIERTIILLGLMLPLAWGCSKDHDLGPAIDARDPAGGGTVPPVPTNVSLDVSNRRLIVSWELPDSDLVDQVRSYRVWRRVPPASDRVLADSAHTSPVTIQGIPNGQSNQISVSSVLKNGLEGHRSVEVSATPGLFAIVIEEGRSVTNTRNVVLELTAPEGTDAVMISSDPDLAEVVTREFLSGLTWSLTDGDGEKVVYGRYIDAEGNRSSVVSDGIRLDTIAEIRTFDFDGDAIRIPGDQILFTLDAGETGGSAEVEIGRGGPRRTLRDDGVDPDAIASDGTYTLRYEAETAQQFLGAEMLGHFSDEAGNIAPTRTASRTLTVHEPPPPLVLEPASSGFPNEISLEWSRVPEGVLFGSYRLYRAEQPGVDTLSTRRLVREITLASQTSHTDTGLEPNRVYYYNVELVDLVGVATPSNEVSATTRSNDPPDAVVLDPPFAVTERSVSLSWGRSFAEDFESYRLLRGEEPGVQEDPQRRTIVELRDATSNSYEDMSEIEEGNTYYYVVVVMDQFGASAASNEVAATIDDLFPSGVTLNAPDPAGETTIGLMWTRNNDLDFESYQLYRSDSPGVDDGDALIVALSEVERIRWIDEGLQENTDYYYRIYVYDKGAHATPSNELLVTTANVDPSAVTLSAPSEVAGANRPSVDLSWTTSSAHDFEAYRIYRDTSPAVEEDATLVRTIGTESTTSYRDEGLDDNRRYYYRVFVVDDAGGSAGSNEGSVVTENRAPTPVTLSLVGSTTTSISLSWTQNVNHDFSEYRLMRGTSPGAIVTTVATFTQDQQTTYSDYLPGQDPNEDLFYMVVIYDDEAEGPGSLSSDSNVISARVGAP